MVKEIGQKGFTLVEVMIAMTIFAVFATVFVMSQSANVNNSILMREDMTLRSLAESKINEVLLDPPNFGPATDKTIETKNFELEGYKKYKYEIKFSKLEIPDFNKLQGNQEDAPTQGNNDVVQKKVFEKLKKNVEQMLWQVQVTVTNTETNYNYTLSTWLENTKAKIDTNFGI